MTCRPVSRKLPRGITKHVGVLVCPAHMDGFLGSKFSKRGSRFWQIFHKNGWAIRKLAKNSKKMGSFPSKLIIKVSITASFSN